METGPQILQLIAALAFVLSLMALLAYALKKLGLSGAIPVQGKTKRLKVIEVLPLDRMRKLAIVQRDDVQHLIIFGGNCETVVETNIPRADNNQNV